MKPSGKENQPNVKLYVMKLGDHYMSHDPTEQMWHLFETVQELRSWDVKANPDNFPSHAFIGTRFRIVALTEEEKENFKTRPK